MTDVLRFEYHKGKRDVFPVHHFVKSCWFNDGEEDEATLAHYIGVIAEKNGLNMNDAIHAIPFVLRMLRSDIQWASQKEAK